MRARLLVTGCVLLALAGCTSSPPGPFQVAPASAVLVSVDGWTLTVMTPYLGCAGRLDPGIEEGARTVTIALTEHPGRPGTYNCPNAVADLHTFGLSRPLGDRKVVDYRGRRVATLGPARLRTPGYLPPGYVLLENVPAAYSPDGPPMSGSTTRVVWSRVYGQPVGATLYAPLDRPLILSQAPQPIPTTGWKRSTGLTVAGHPATLYLGSPGQDQDPFRKQALAWSDHGWYVMLVVAPGPYATHAAVTHELTQLAAGLVTPPAV